MLLAPCTSALASLPFTQLKWQARDLSCDLGQLSVGYQLESFSASDLYRLLTKSPEKHLCPLDKKRVQVLRWRNHLFFSVWHGSWKSCHRPKPFSLPMSSWVPSCKVLILRKALYLSDLHQFCLPFASQKDQEVINPWFAGEIRLWHWIDWNGHGDAFAEVWREAYHQSSELHLWYQQVQLPVWSSQALVAKKKMFEQNLLHKKKSLVWDNWIANYSSHTLVALGCVTGSLVVSA